MLAPVQRTRHRHGYPDHRKGNPGRHRRIHRNVDQRPQSGLSSSRSPFNPQCKGLPMSGPVHWHEGLFLQPHHLQTMQHHLLERYNAERKLSFIFPYGVIDMKMSADALENMLVRFDRLRVIMPSGLEVSFPDNADLPSLDIKQAFEASSNAFTVSLAVPLWYATRANAVDLAAGNTGGGTADWRVKRMYKV